ncbi:epsin-1 isoform X1 [Periophthalmus magnuspinnatus]|uniref:epsin-1 isoform X1 n=1 Tax=Periophthalmus magnuspinnatus TaxID=409849 RepID=UPI00145A9DD8|nr:epsin-1 isoform X1 [Periophthalmus magnuspinnatus]XP_055083550.1 epsin-1 isoform X1 [Periophthalmus magnuspinnatus]
MSTSSLRRQVKNIVHNYSEAEIKVREATSNDPWGPSSSLMSEIADLTYNVVAFSEIMSMVWKRLNDHGKNWRHVYKAMTLMEYLIKTGSERVAQQCRENIYAVQTLKDFQYIDRDGKDQGVNVREKAKQLVTLLKDEERLREERIHALKTKEKMAQTSSASSAPSAPGVGGSLSLGSHSGGADPEQAWPQSSGEEDLQLQLALAMSKEEAEQTSADPLEDADLRYAISLSQEMHQQEERLRRGDDLRLQMAIEESKREKPKSEESALMELSAVDPWGAAAAAPPVGSAGPSPPPSLCPPAASNPWGAPAPDPWAVASPTSPTNADPWGGGPPTVAPPPDPWGEASNRVNNVDPWGGSAVTTPSADPWGPSVPPSTSSSGGPVDPWARDGPVPASDPVTSDLWSGTAQHTNGTGDPERRGSSAAACDSTGSPVPFDLSSLGSSLPVRKTPESFLGPNAALVDLDSLVSSKPKPKQPPPPSISSSSAHNPFLQNTGSSPAPGMAVTPGSTISSRGVSPTPASSNPFGVAPSMTSISPQPSTIGLSALRTSPVPPNPMLGMVQPGLGMGPMGMGAPGMGLGMVQASPLGMPYSGLSPMAPPGSGLLGPGAAPQLILGGPTAGGVMGGGGAVGGGGTAGASTNPFLL